MTKEALYKRLSQHPYSDPLAKVLDEFFDSNVVTPRGENRHPSSDILHKAIEGIKIQAWNHIRNEWEDDTSWFICKNDLDYPTKYRIKPSGPIYEWQWCLMNKAKNEITAYMASNNHLTDEEAEEWIQKQVNKEHFLPIKIEETKRVRQ